jgi:hypothetical protein
VGLPNEAHGNTSATRRELHRVRQQIPEDLLEPIGISDERLPAPAEVGHELDALRGGGRSNHVDGRLDHGDDVAWLGVEADLPGSDPRRIQHVGHEPGEHTTVPIDDFGGPLTRGRLDTGRPQDVRVAHDGVQWRAQFMREHRQEILLRPVRVLEFGRQPLLFGDVAGDLGRTDHAPIGRPER